MRQEVEALAARSSKAEHEYYAIMHHRHQAQRAAAKAAEERIHAEFEERERAAYEAFTEARSAYHERRLAWALSGTRTPYPVGTRVRKWRNVWGTEHWIDQKDEGILEVVTEETRHPLGYGPSDYRRAKIGDLVVRLLKGNGQPGIRYERIEPSSEASLAKRWRPVAEERRR